MSTRLAEEQLHQIVSLYEEGYSIYHIAPLIGCAPQTIHKKLVLLDVERRDRSGLSPAAKEVNLLVENQRVKNKQQKTDATATHHHQIAQRYANGESMRELSRKTGHKMCSLKRWIEDNGVERRTLSQACRVHSLDENAFTLITTEPQAYWLGFLTADGGISERNTLRLNLQERDRCHVEAFQSFLQTSVPVASQTVRYKDKYYPVAYLNVSSPKICADLAQYGLGPRKSKTVRWPSRLPPELSRHYIRGLFDGDGTWGKGPKWQLLGNRPILLEIQELLMRNCNVKKTKLVDHHTTPDIAALVYNGRQQLFRVALWMYVDATIFLERKWRDYQDRK